MRAEQRESTRNQIVTAALLAISESGFEGVSTRAVAARANVSQGLLTYHFKSKEALWRAAADQIFDQINDTISQVLNSGKKLDPREKRRQLICNMVKFSATHPEFMRFMLEKEDGNSERSRWLVDTHLRPIYKLFGQIMTDTPKAELPHLFYIITGASMLVFSAQKECRHLTGIDPCTNAAVKRHGNMVADLIEPG